MKLFIANIIVLLTLGAAAQDSGMVGAANNFLNLLGKQRPQAVYPYEASERYIWSYVPRTDRKGISINEMSEKQKTAAIALMKTALSEAGYKKATAIMRLENVLKAIEQRADDDHYRDTGKYYFTIFGEPSAKTVWGWRLDGHHLSFNFSSNGNKLVSGTPGFLGANPAVVLSGPQKGLEILKEENELAFEFLHSLDKDQLNKALTTAIAPPDIVTAASRKAGISDTGGLKYSDMSVRQRETFMQLVSLYIHRYTHLFARSMMADIEAAGLNRLLFAWAGSTENGPGHKRYYRIQGPTIIIEYDNTQNNGNHVHTVVRDLKNDFGGDVLLEHYKKGHN